MDIVSPPLKTSSQNPEKKTQKTKVIAAVYGPRVPPGRPSGTAASAAAEIRVELSIAEFAAAAGGAEEAEERGAEEEALGPNASSAEQRAVGSGGRDRRAGEAAQALRDALEATVLASLHPRSRIDVCVSVLAADGAWLAAAVNAASAASPTRASPAPTSSPPPPLRSFQEALEIKVPCCWTLRTRRSAATGCW